MIERAVAALTSFPEVVEVDWRGHRTFTVGRRSFAGVDENGLACRADKAERPALVQRPWFVEPPFVARYGWIGVRFDAVDDWGEVEELLETAYRITAPKRLVRLLDLG
ncbi:MAG TPA: MmcQ/YjbR family DNA-binding protein [Acidimicrobiales bacterium]|nr:MmcQ/YjbR family DNA-binding protein [Acidimicrobiales bacterium]